MKIGVFDSGLGGLFTMRAIAKALPEYDYVYLGDTKRMPYGSRSHTVIYEFLREGVDFLFAKGCALVIVACNTASAEALRQLQQRHIPKRWPGRNALGMIVPMTEACAGYARVGLIGTAATISSGAYEREFKKRGGGGEGRARGPPPRPPATPLLAHFIESGEIRLMRPVLADDLSYFKNKHIDALLLGCTHYGIAKAEFRKLLPKSVAIISQDTVVPKKLKDYFARHPELAGKLSRRGQREFYVTDITDQVKKLAAGWFGESIAVKKVSIEKA